MSTYKDTLFLPQTSFSMRANLPVMELKILDHWQRLSLYKILRQQSQGREKFILHWGPPYANGNLHIGHALTGILKDFVVKHKQMSGYDAPLVPGWDCHGLPIEWKIEEQNRANGKTKDSIPINEFRQECRVFADKWIAVQKEEEKRLGIVADWDNPYITMDATSEAHIVEKLFTFLEQGTLYKGCKPVMWSVVEQTALAETEIEYKDHQSHAVYVAFPVKHSPLTDLQTSSILIWTTTPWSLPANRAIAYGPDIIYTLICVKEVHAESLVKPQQRFVIAQDLVRNVCSTLGITDFIEEKIINGTDLEGTTCHHPLTTYGYDHDVPLLAGIHVNIDAGTGLVHMAPCHGPEDFELGNTYNLEIPDTIADDGYFRANVHAVAGIHVFKANKPIVEMLLAAGSLAHHTVFTHSYPHSWRSKAPLIYRTTPQWFLSMDRTNLRDKAMKAIETVTWHPVEAKNRITSMVENRPDWCLSRQRIWGVPIPLFIEKASGKVLCDQHVNARIVQIFHDQGCEAWFRQDKALFLGTQYQADDYEQVRDIMDVWFESGASFGYVLEDRPELSFPADVYLEGSDQHRGWFQSALMIGCETKNSAPYKHVVTHGFTLDDQGRKMSKSTGNVVAPQTIIDKSGAEIIRLWVAFADYHQDCRIGAEILKQVEDNYRRFRNTLRYLLGALAEYNQDQENVAYTEMPELERWILHRLSEITVNQQQYLKNFNFSGIINEIHNFCALDLSAFYFDIRKDRVYCDDVKSPERRATRTIFAILFNHLVKWLAPFMSFTTEEAWLSRYPHYQIQADHDAKSDCQSVHMQLFEPLQQTWLDEKLAEKMINLRNQRRLMTGALEKARASGIIGSSLQASLKIYDPEHQLYTDVDYTELCIVSNVIKVNHPLTAPFTLADIPNLSVEVITAEGEKCERCWKITPEVTQIHTHPDLCQRCHTVVVSVKKAL